MASLAVMDPCADGPNNGATTLGEDMSAGTNSTPTGDGSERANDDSTGDAELKLKEMGVQLETVSNQLQRFAVDNAHLKEQLSLHQDIIQAKDQIIVSLTNKVFDLEHSSPRSRSSSKFYAQGDDLKELEALRDSVRAYKMQNEYLSNQIVEINDSLVAGNKKQQELQLKIHDWEAKSCQIQSKLLSLLKELKQLHDTPNDAENKSELAAKEESIKALVNRLLNERSIDIPLSWRQGNRSRNSASISSQRSVSDYDELGFNMKMSMSDDTISEPGEERKRRDGSVNRLEDGKSSVANWRSRWDAYVVSLGEVQKLMPNDRLKNLLRSGVPQEYRSKIWRLLIDARVDSIRQFKGSEYYERLVTNQVDSPTGSPPVRSRLYDPTAKQIELDLLRTLPHNRHFESLESDGTCRLRKVLTAFSRHNPSVGYCQGLNRLAAVALLFMPEEDAFWCLVAIVEKIMPSQYYSQNLLGAHVDQYVFRDLLADKLPRVHYHLDQFGIEISLFSWFLTCFVDNIPVAVYLRIWDVFLYEGNKVLFRFALAFFKMHEEEILNLRDSVLINTLIRTLGERKFDLNQLCKIAFTVLNPLPMARIRSKRAYYTNLVKEELKKLDDFRKALPDRVGSDSGQSD